MLTVTFDTSCAIDVLPRSEWDIRRSLTGIAALGDFMYCSPGRMETVMVIDSRDNQLHFIYDEEVFDDSRRPRMCSECFEFSDWDEDVPYHLWSGIAAYTSKLLASR